jgi:hypothetical protein
MHYFQAEYVYLKDLQRIQTVLFSYSVSFPARNVRLIFGVCV